MLDGRTVVHQRQKLDFGRSQVGFGGLHIGFELDALQFQAVQVHLCDVAGLEPVAAHHQQPVVIRQVVPGQRQYRFGLQGLYKCAAQAEKKSSLQVRLLRHRDGSALLGALQPQLPLVLPLVEVAGGDQRQGVCQRAVRIGREWVELIERGGEVGVRPQVGRHLLGLGFIDAELAGTESRIRSFELVANFLPRESLLRADALGQANRDQKRHR